MSRTTGIEWTEHTWNPWAGCKIKSPGCKNCYAMRQAARIESFGNAPHYSGLTKKKAGRIIWTGEVHKATETTMRKPLTIKGSEMIFVCSMSDFFNSEVPDEWRLEAFRIMKRTDHIYQILTKRPENIEPFLRRTGTLFPGNAWVGVTVEDEKQKDRIDMLRAVSDFDIMVKFISFEPLLCPIGNVDLSGIDWAIVGGESGPGARPMNYEWVKELADSIRGQNVPLFFKQWGQPKNNPLFNCAMQGSFKLLKEKDRIGKGGSLLDDLYFKEYPSQRKHIS